MGRGACVETEGRPMSDGGGSSLVAVFDVRLASTWDLDPLTRMSRRCFDVSSGVGVGSGDGFANADASLSFT